MKKTINAFICIVLIICLCMALCGCSAKKEELVKDYEDKGYAVADFSSVKLSELTNYCDVYLNDIEAVEWAVFGQKEGSSDWVEIIGFTSSKNANRYSKTDRYKDLEKSYTDPVTGEKQVSVHKTVKGSVFILEVVYEK